MTADQTLDEILNLAAVHFKVPREKLNPDDDFFTALGIDSLQTLELLTSWKIIFMSNFRTTNCKGSPTSARSLGRFRRGSSTTIMRKIGLRPLPSSSR